MQVRHILGEKGRDVIAISSDATLSEAARLLARKRIGAIVVRDEAGGLAGILSERDVVRAVADGSGLGAGPSGQRLHDARGRHLLRARHGGGSDGDDDRRPLPACAGGGR